MPLSSADKLHCEMANKNSQTFTDVLLSISRCALTVVCVFLNRKNCTESWRKLHQRSNQKFNRSLLIQLPVNVMSFCSWLQTSSLTVILFIDFYWQIQTVILNRQNLF